MCSKSVLVCGCVARAVWPSLDLMTVTSLGSQCSSLLFVYTSIPPEMTTRISRAGCKESWKEPIP